MLQVKCFTSYFGPRPYTSCDTAYLRVWGSERLSPPRCWGEGMNRRHPNVYMLLRQGRGLSSHELQPHNMLETRAACRLDRARFRAARAAWQKQAGSFDLYASHASHHTLVHTHGAWRREPCHSRGGLGRWFCDRPDAHYCRDSTVLC